MEPAPWLMWEHGRDECAEGGRDTHKCNTASTHTQTHTAVQSEQKWKKSTEKSCSLFQSGPLSLFCRWRETPVFYFHTPTHKYTHQCMRAVHSPRASSVAGVMGEQHDLFSFCAATILCCHPLFLPFFFWFNSSLLSLQARRQRGDGAPVTHKCTGPRL